MSPSRGGRGLVLAVAGTVAAAAREPGSLAVTHRIENLRLMLAAGGTAFAGAENGGAREMLLDGIPSDPRDAWLTPVIRSELGGAAPSGAELDAERIPYPYLKLLVEARQLRTAGRTSEADAAANRARHMASAASARVAVISSWFMLLFLGGIAILLMTIPKRPPPPEMPAPELFGRGIAVFGGWLAAYVAVALVLVPAARGPSGRDLPILAAGYALHGVAALVLARSWLARPAGATLRGLLAGTRPGPAAIAVTALTGLAAAVPLMLLAFAASAPLHLGSGSGNPALRMLVEGSGASQALLLGLLCVGAPLVEETVFRAALLPALLSRVRPSIAIAASAACFAMVHLDLPVLFPLAALGLVLGYLRVRTGSTLPSMAMHALWNFQSFVLVKLLLGDIAT